MGSNLFLSTLNQSLQEGNVNVQAIDQACRRILEAKFKLGLFDNPFRYINYSRPQTDSFTEDNRPTARDFARRSFVLLKNNKQVLPLARSNRTIALVGPLADDHRTLLGSWNAEGANLLEDPNMLRLLNRSSDFILDNRTAEQMIDEAPQLAAKSDVVVAVVVGGESRGMTDETTSRADISLPACRHRLLQALFNSSKPVVIVLMNGRPLTLTYENQSAIAVLETWFGGTETGSAVAKVLFGYYNPAGALTVTFTLPTEELKLYDLNLTYIREEGVFNIFVGPDSVNTQPTQVYWHR